MTDVEFSMFCEMQANQLRLRDIRHNLRGWGGLMDARNKHQRDSAVVYSSTL